MKKFKDFIRESDLISLGGSASNRTGRWGQEPVHMGVHRIEDPNVLQRLNAHVGLVNTREYIDPRSALEHVQNALMRLGYHFDYNLNDMPNEQNVYPLRRFGGRQGFLDMDAEIKEDDGIENSVGERLVLNMEFFQDPDSSRYEVMAQIVPASLFDEEEVQPEAIRSNRAGVASTSGDRDGINMGEARELDIDKMTRTLVKKTDDGRWQVFVWSPKVKQMIPQGQPFKSRQAAEKDARKFHEQVMNEDVSRTFAFPTSDSRDRMEKLLGLATRGGVSTSDKGKGKFKFTVTSVLKTAQLDRIMNSVKQLRGKLSEGTPADIANSAVRNAIRERAERLHERDPFRVNQLKVARDTLKMNPVFQKVMGGPSREEAIRILMKHGSTADKKLAQKEAGIKEFFAQTLSLQMARDVLTGSSRAKRTDMTKKDAAEYLLKKGDSRDKKLAQRVLGGAKTKSTEGLNMGDLVPRFRRGLSVGIPIKEAVSDKEIEPGKVFMVKSGSKEVPVRIIRKAQMSGPLTKYWGENLKTFKRVGPLTSRDLRREVVRDTKQSDASKEWIGVNEGVQVFPAEVFGKGSWNVEAAFSADDWKGPLLSAVKKEIKKAGWKSFDIREDKTIRVVVRAQSGQKAQKQVSDLVAKARKSIGVSEACNDVAHDENGKKTFAEARRDFEKSGAGFTAVAIQNNKVVDQIHSLEKSEIRHAVFILKQRHRGAKVSIEDERGKVVRVEAKDENEKELERTRKDDKQASAFEALSFPKTRETDFHSLLGYTIVRERPNQFRVIDKKNKDLGTFSSLAKASEFIRSQ